MLHCFRILGIARLLCFSSCLSFFFSLPRTHFSSPAPGVPFARLDAGALATQPCVVFSPMCVLLFWFLSACDRAQGKPGTSQVCPVLTSQLCWSLARTRLRSRVRSSFLSAGLCLQRRRPWREVHPKWLRSFSFVVCFSHPPWWVRAGVFLILLLLLGACPCGSFARLFTASYSFFPSGGVPVLLLYVCSLHLLGVFSSSCSIAGGSLSSGIASSIAPDPSRVLGTGLEVVPTPASARCSSCCFNSCKERRAAGSSGWALSGTIPTQAQSAPSSGAAFFPVAQPATCF